MKESIPQTCSRTRARHGIRDTPYFGGRGWSYFSLRPAGKGICHVPKTRLIENIGMEPRCQAPKRESGYLVTSMLVMKIYVDTYQYITVTGTFEEASFLQLLDRGGAMCIEYIRG